MNHEFEEFIKNNIELLRGRGNLRELPQILHNGPFVISEGKKMVNLSSNDYLGIAARCGAQADFFENLGCRRLPAGSSSSRLLTGNFEQYTQVEEYLARRYAAQAALCFSSGYHLNSGLLPAICNGKTLILADKLVHASLIDGIRLSRADSIRYRHQDYEQLTNLLKKHHNSYERIIIVTESIFSMDGDVAPLATLARLKREFKNVLLYVDEAHAVGVRGKSGLGVAEEQNCIEQIDFLCGTLGKAYASHGAFVICSELVKKYLVNHARTLIFTTALPPLIMEWSLYTMRLAEKMESERVKLREWSKKINALLEKKGNKTLSESHIIPLMVGDSALAVKAAAEFREAGFYLLPVRPPTVPEGSSRIRISLCGAVTDEQMSSFLKLLENEK